MPCSPSCWRWRRTPRCVPIEEDRLRWYVLTGVAVGFGFLTKQLQAFLVVPGFALALLIAGQGSIWRRHPGPGGRRWRSWSSAGWWVAAVELGPRVGRPYIGGSQGNSFLELTFGYNGLGRITGNEGRRARSAGPGGGGGISAGTRHHPHVRRRDRRPDRLARSRPCSWPWWSACGCRAGLRGPTCAAGVAHRVGDLAGRHRSWCSASWAGSSTSTTPSPWPRRSPRSSASAASMLWGRRQQWAAMATAAVAVGLSTWWAHDLLSRGRRGTPG